MYCFLIVCNKFSQTGNELIAVAKNFSKHFDESIKLGCLGHQMYQVPTKLVKAVVSYELKLNILKLAA